MILYQILNYYSGKCNTDECNYQCVKACPNQNLVLNELIDGSKYLEWQDRCEICESCALSCPNKALVWDMKNEDSKESEKIVKFEIH